MLSPTKVLMCTLLVASCATGVYAQLPVVPDPFLSPVLPQAIQDCIDAGTCTNLEPVFGNPAPLFRRYRYTDSSSGTATQMELLQYAIGGDSGITTVNLDTGSASTNGSFSGAAWVAMQSEYDLSSDTHQMQLFFEQVSPTALPGLGLFEPMDLIDQRIDISLTTEGLLTGSGNVFIAADSNDERNSSSLEIQNLPFIVCLADCYAGAEFNLLNANFSQVGSTAIASFSSSQLSVDGELLFSTFDGFPGFDDEISFPRDEFPAEEFQRNFFVGAASVPEPSSTVLLLGLGLATAARRSKRKSRE